MDLKRFEQVQKLCIKEVKAEIRSGYKETHWIWFIFPQLKGLGSSMVSNYYGLNNLEEAREYYDNKYLRKNLLSCFRLVLKLEDERDLSNCFGMLDSVKIRSCATLFYIATKKNIFKKFLDKFFEGLLDNKTMLLLQER